MDKAVKTYITVLKAEVEHLKSKLEPHDTGHIHTTIRTLEDRVDEIQDEIDQYNRKNVNEMQFR